MSAFGAKRTFWLFLFDASGLDDLGPLFISVAPVDWPVPLAGEFTDAKLVHDDRALRTDLDKTLTFIKTPAKGLDLRLDIRGTAFQRRVWDALLGVRVGYKITYAALASRIGEPRAIRAVANACAANAIALAIPCHRVVRSDGALVGYRWGAERKKVIVEKEAEALA